MLTTKYVANYIVGTLGGSDVAVELNPSDIELCAEEALRRYSRLNPLKNREARQAPPGGITSYPLHHFTRSVSDVEIQNALMTFESMSSQEFNLFNSWHLINAGYSSGLSKADEYELTLQWRQMTARVYSLDPDYYVDDDPQYDENSDDATKMVPRQIHFYNPTGLQMKVSWVETSDRPLNLIPAADEDWVLSYALAHAKEILGRKRGKFRTLPVAGQPLELDGPALIEEAKMEKAELLEDLRQRFIGLNYPIYG